MTFAAIHIVIHSKVMFLLRKNPAGLKLDLKSPRAVGKPSYSKFYNFLKLLS